MPHFLISIEPASIQTVEDFARELWDGIQQACARLRPGEPGQGYFSLTTFGGFGAKLQELLQPIQDGRFFVFLDEFDKLWQAVDNITINQVAGLVRYIVELTNLPIAFVVSTLRSPDLFWTSFGSPPSPLTVSLPPFDRGECDTMLLSFFPKELGRCSDLLTEIYLASGGHPYFAKLLAAEVFDRHSSDKAFSEFLSPLCWEQFLKAAATTPQATDVFKFVYEHSDNDQRFVLLSVAMQADGVVSGEQVARWRVAQRTAARKLEGRYYLVPLADGGYRLRLPLFGYWLRQWSESGLESERLGVTAPAVEDIPQHGVYVRERSGEVYVDGRLIEEELPNLQYRALVYLVRNAGRVVSRDELYQALHDADEAYVPTDQSLDALFYRLRLALGDREQRYLKTVRKRGFVLTQGAIIT